MEVAEEIDERILDKYIIEKEGPPIPKICRNLNRIRKSRKYVSKKTSTNVKKSGKNENKMIKSKQSAEKLSIIKRKKSPVETKTNNSVIIVNENSDSESEYICYPEVNTSQEDSNGENRDPLEQDLNYDELIDEVYERNDTLNLIEEDEKLVKNYLSRDCCKRRCNTKFKSDELLQYRVELQSLDYNENGVNQLDVVLLGLIHSLCRISNEISHSRIIEIKTRRRIKMMFGFRGVSVCRAMFMFAHAIKIERLKRLLKHYKEHGIAPRAHGNYKRIPANAISVEQMQEVVSFLKRYADENGIVIKGRSAYQNEDIKILPPHETKSRVFNKYKQACEEQNLACISVVSFRRLWNRFCPNVMIQRSSSQTSKIPPSTASENEISDFI